ncbi:MAG: ABC transporter transmembrane domain-containing protein [Acidimicrobiales bacterium]
MTSTLERDLTGLAGGGRPRDETASPFEPLAVQARSGPPLGHIDPDRSLGWLKRVRPLLAARKVAFGSALFAALVAMVAQVAVPRVTMAAIDSALTERTSSVMPFVWTLLALALVRGLLTFAYRLTLYRVAYDLEYDLRVGIYEHLTRMSFSFYDRVQTGQLISRANSDIRSIQMFLTFAPLMILNAASFAVAFALMLAVHVPLALVALAPLPFVYLAGRKMRDLLFPISWIVQARQADVATTRNAGARWSSAARVPPGRPAAGAAEAALGLRTDDARAHWAPVMENLRGSAWPACCSTVVGHRRAGHGGRRGLQHLRRAAVTPRMLGFLMMLSQRASASAARLRDPRHRSRRRRPARGH